MKILIRICEKCGVVHPKNIDRERCIYLDCNGKLILVFIDTSDNGDTKIPFQEDIS